MKGFTEETSETDFFLKTQDRELIFFTDDLISASASISASFFCFSYSFEESLFPDRKSAIALQAEIIPLKTLKMKSITQIAHRRQIRMS